MRLIDADEYKDYIIDSLEGYKLLTNEYRDFARDIIRGFLKDIDTQPTAYDIDNKVRQLEAWKEKQLAIADREIAESDSELRKGIIKELKAITDACIENSIKIVKGGQNERSVESC